MFELSEFELSGVNYYKKYCQIQGELDLVRVNEEFELSEFELAGDYCIPKCCIRNRQTNMGERQYKISSSVHELMGNHDTDSTKIAHPPNGPTCSNIGFISYSGLQ